MITIESASTLSIEDLSALVTRCYHGYYVPVSFDAATYARMISAWDLDLKRSRVLVADGTPVAVTMLGVRGARGWIGGGDAKLAAATALWLGFDQLLRLDNRNVRKCGTRHFGATLFEYIVRHQF